MHPQAVVPRPAEGGDQAGVDVQNPVWIGRQHPGPDHGQIPCQHHALGPEGRQPGRQGLVEGVGAVIVFPAHHRRGHTGLLGPLQGIGPRAGGDHPAEFGRGQPARRLGVQQGLQVRAPAAHQHGHLHTSATSFSPFTTSPST